MPRWELGKFDLCEGDGRAVPLKKSDVGISFFTAKAVAQKMLRCF